MIAQTDSDPCAQCWARIAALTVCTPKRTMQALYHNRATLPPLIPEEVNFSVVVKHAFFGIKIEDSAKYKNDSLILPSYK